MTRRRLLLATAGALLMGALSSGYAQGASPAGRQTRIIVPYPPGGASDALARALAERLSLSMGHRVLVDNKPGGGAVIGTQAALAAPADGQTLLLMAASFVIQPQLLAKAPYDAKQDFVPVIHAASNPHVLVVHPSTPATNLAEFIAWAKAQRGAASFASFGNGSSGHMGFERLKKAAGIDLIHVPYKGSAPAMQNLLGGQVPAMLTDLPQALPFIKSGKIKAIAVGSASRDSTLPEVPTFAEAGLKGLVSESWFGFVVRAGTPPEQVVQLNRAIQAALRDPSMKSALEPTGLNLLGGTPEQFGAFLASETSRYQDVIQSTGMKAE